MKTLIGPRFFGPRFLAASILAAASVAVLTDTALAAPVSNHLSVSQLSAGLTETVQYRGWGGPVAGGIIAGAIIGGALAAPRYYGPDPYYAGPPRDSDYCAQRFRTYDPASGTYLGHDGLRHPCP